MRGDAYTYGTTASIRRGKRVCHANLAAQDTLDNRADPICAPSAISTSRYAGGSVRCSACSGRSKPLQPATSLALHAAANSLENVAQPKCLY